MNPPRERTKPSIDNIGHNIRNLRKRAGITLRILAQRTGLTEAHISKVERGISAPSIASLDRIAEALGISITQLLADPQSTSQTPYTRTRLRMLRRLGAGIGYEELIPSEQEGPLSASLFVVQPGQGSGDLSKHLGYEFRMVLDGEVTYYLADERIILGVGDTLFAEASVPHRWANEGDIEARMVVVATMPLHQA